MGQKRKQLSHAEIWDDSALLQSWDDALAEYKFYHSIHARGERVEDVIKEVVAEEKLLHTTQDHLRQAAARTPTNGVSSVMPEDGELEEGFKSAQEHPNGGSIGSLEEPSTSESKQQQLEADASTPAEHPQKLRMPDVKINGVNDDTLRNLMMSWYYAGYYSGLYEGQQQL